MSANCSGSGDSDAGERGASRRAGRIMSSRMSRLRLAYNTNGLAHHRLADAIDLVSALSSDGRALTPDEPFSVA